MSDLKVGKITLGSFQTNCYYIYREGNDKAIVIDPAEQGNRIYEMLKGKGFYVAAILLTHGHVDHIAGVSELKALSGAKVYANEKEADLLEDMKDNLSLMFGTPLKVTADELLQDGKRYMIGDISFQMFSTPGHTAGGCVYYFEEGGFLISGDTLFEGSVGRTDFPTGSMSLLVRSIKDKLFSLPDKTICYPGHGGTTTIGWEKDTNPFVC